MASISINFAVFIKTSLTFPSLYSAVHSLATRCNPLLNMVLDAIYFIQRIASSLLCVSNFFLSYRLIGDHERFE